MGQWQNGEFNAIAPTNGQGVKPAVIPVTPEALRAFPLSLRASRYGRDDAIAARRLLLGISDTP
jgi:hypothetical protein